MRILVFTEGTTIMHRTEAGLTPEQISNRVSENWDVIHDYAAYTPIGHAPEKLTAWKNQGAEILYCTSRVSQREINDVRGVLTRYGFPDGELHFRREGEGYEDVIERVVPDILIEDDCASIGGSSSMCITNVEPKVKAEIKSIPVREFSGIDHLPDNIALLLDC